MIIEQYNNKYLDEATKIWNNTIRSGLYFPQEHTLSLNEATRYFKKQDFTGIALINDEVVGVYILHANSIGRIDHVANASYAVKETARGNKIGEKLVLHSMKKAKELNYRILQFNAVVASNQSAIHLYEKIGFNKIGVVPQSYKTISGQYEDLILYYINLYSF